MAEEDQLQPGVEEVVQQEEASEQGPTSWRDRVTNAFSEAGRIWMESNRSSWDLLKRLPELRTREGARGVVNEVAGRVESIAQNLNNSSREGRISNAMIFGYFFGATGIAFTEIYRFVRQEAIRRGHIIEGIDNKDLRAKAEYYENRMSEIESLIANLRTESLRLSAEAEDCTTGTEQERNQKRLRVIEFSSEINRLFHEYSSLIEKINGIICDLEKETGAADEGDIPPRLDPLQSPFPVEPPLAPPRKETKEVEGNEGVVFNIPSKALILRGSFKKKFGDGFRVVVSENKEMSDPRIVTAITPDRVTFSDGTSISQRVLFDSKGPYYISIEAGNEPSGIPVPVTAPPVPTPPVPTPPVPTPPVPTPPVPTPPVPTPPVPTPPVPTPPVPTPPLTEPSVMEPEILDIDEYPPFDIDEDDGVEPPESESEDRFENMMSQFFTDHIWYPSNTGSNEAQYLVYSSDFVKGVVSLKTYYVDGTESPRFEDVSLKALLGNAYPDGLALEAWTKMRNSDRYKKYFEDKQKPTPVQEEPPVPPAPVSEVIIEDDYPELDIDEDDEGIPPKQSGGGQPPSEPPAVPVDVQEPVVSPVNLPPIHGQLVELPKVNENNPSEKEIEELLNRIFNEHVWDYDTPKKIAAEIMVHSVDIPNDRVSLTIRNRDGSESSRLDHTYIEDLFFEKHPRGMDIAAWNTFKESSTFKTYMANQKKTE